MVEPARLLCLAPSNSKGTVNARPNVGKYMDLIIDGYNLLHAVGIHAPRRGPPNLEGARGALLQFLAATLSAEDRQRTTVVFDAGPEAPRGLPRRIVDQEMTIHFSSGYENADALIEELILACSSPRSLTVVSSDHRIQRAAKKRRAEAIDSEAWYARVCQNKIEKINPAADKPRTPETPDEVERWLEKFQTDGASSEIDEIEQGLKGTGPFPSGYAEDLLDLESDPKDK